MPPSPRTPKQPGPQALLLRAGRLQAGLTQADAAEALGVHYQTLAHWERGRQMLTKPDTVARVAALYNLDADMIHIAAGQLAPDLVAYLCQSPRLVRRLRQSMPTS